MRRPIQQIRNELSDIEDAARTNRNLAMPGTFEHAALAYITRLAQIIREDFAQ